MNKWIKQTKKIPDWAYEAGVKKGLSYQTIYQRWRRDPARKKGGWPDWDYILREPHQRTISKHKKRGEPHSFRLPLEYEELFKQRLKETDMTIQDFVAEIVIKELKS